MFMKSGRNQNRTRLDVWKKRDDVLKQHPCLVPYEELPEEEKVYDRNSSVETLKLIMKLGFKISKDEE